MKSLLDMTELNWTAFEISKNNSDWATICSALCSEYAGLDQNREIHLLSLFFLFSLKIKSDFEDTNQEAIWSVGEPNINGSAISPTIALLSLMPTRTPVQKKPRRCFMMLHFISAIGWSKRLPRHSGTLPALWIMSDSQQYCQPQAVRNLESDPHSAPTQQTDHFTYKALDKHKPFQLEGRIAFWNWNLWVLHSAAMRIKLSWARADVLKYSYWIQGLKL